MQRGWKSVAVALAATLVLASGALAQRGGRGGFGGGRQSGLAILRMPEVQTELKLTDDQKTKVVSLSERIQEERRGQLQELRDLSDEERQKRMTEWRMSENKQLGEILNADQMKRYNQLRLQRAGLSVALAEKEVVDELKLTADQQTKVREIIQAQQAERRSLFQDGGGGGDREAMMEKMQALQKQTDAKLVALLTDEQKTKWAQLIGTPFTFPQGQGPARAA
jgi:Spy/CpxP family protein refolding chaperone